MTNQLKGVGINLRLEYIDQVLAQRPDVDFLQIITENWFSKGPHHKKLEKLRSDYEISFHCVGMNIAGHDELNTDHINKVRELIDIYRPYLVSDHLCLSAHNGVQFHDLLPFPYCGENLQRVSERVHAIQDILKRNIALENLSYYVKFKNSEQSEFEFLSELTEQTGSGILLDLNNLWVNEKNNIESISTELEKLNFNFVKEVHVAGAEKFDDTYIDTHGSDIHIDVLNLVEKYKNKLSEIPVIYEKDTNISSLEDSLKQAQLVKGRLK